MTAAALLSFFHRLHLAAPAWLWLLAVAPALFLVAFASLGDFTRGERIAQSVLRTLVLAGLALALAQPTIRRDATAVSLVALADVSDSVSDADLDATRTLIRKLEQAPTPGVLSHPIPTRVVRFAATPAEVVSAAPPTPPPTRPPPPLPSPPMPSPASPPPAPAPPPTSPSPSASAPVSSIPPASPASS